jgi:hypothetical protein
VTSAAPPVSLVVAGVACRVHVEAGFAEALRDRFAGRPAAFAEELPDAEALALTLAGSVARVRWGDREGRLDLARLEIWSPPSLVFADALVRAAVAFGLADRGGVLLHAAAVPHAGGAAVVFGASGAGKTTLSRACPDALADELTCVERDGAGFVVGATPWWRGGAARAPLRRLVWLVRGEAPSRRTVSGGELLRALAAECGRYLPDPGFQRRVFEVLADLASLGALRVAAAEGRVAQDVLGALEP